MLLSVNLITLHSGKSHFVYEKGTATDKMQTSTIISLFTKK